MSSSPESTRRAARPRCSSASARAGRRAPASVSALRGIFLLRPARGAGGFLDAEAPAPATSLSGPPGLCLGHRPLLRRRARPRLGPTRPLRGAPGRPTPSPPLSCSCARLPRPEPPRRLSALTSAAPPCPRPHPTPHPPARTHQVFVCTLSEGPYAREMWRLLDPEGRLIRPDQRERRIVTVPPMDTKTFALALGGGAPAISLPLSGALSPPFAPVSDARAHRAPFAHPHPPARLPQTPTRRTSRRRRRTSP